MRAREANAEKQFPKTLGKYGVDAFRRPSEKYKKQDDCEIPALKNVKIDSKYSVRSFSLNRLFAVCEAKYCANKSDAMIIVSKGYKEPGQKCTVDSEYLAMLIGYWLGTGTKEELQQIYNER